MTVPFIDTGGQIGWFLVLTDARDDEDGGEW